MNGRRLSVSALLMISVAVAVAGHHPQKGKVSWTVVPAPDDKIQMRSPVGMWSGAVGERGGGREAYRVNILEIKGRIVAYWLDPATGGTAYLGLWEKKGDDWQEVYCPPGRECRPWLWTWDGKAWQGTAAWVLQGAKPDF